MAKASEIERRKHVHRMIMARGSVERERLNRLQLLVGLYDNFSSLGTSERERVTALLRSMVWDPLIINPAKTSPPSNMLGDITNREAEREFPLVLWGNAHQDIHVVNPHAESMRPDHPAHEESFGLSSRGEEYLDREHPPTFTLNQRTQPTRDQPIRNTEDLPTLPPPPSPVNSAENISSAIASLYFDYFHSLPKLSCLSTHAPTPPSLTSDADFNSAIDIDHTEYAMTKTQYQLTLEEGKLWSDLVGSSNSDERATTTKANLASLATKSGLMSESYQRRMNPPSAQTYEESKEVLNAMGVPCIEPTGPYEAEALAASLVINGLADYVASEDTDVLIYEAPLLRNLTNRQEPLIIVSGMHIRTVLQLNRAAYIDFALLLGTDFSQRIKNVGPTRALKFIREHGSIERVVEVETRYPPRIPRETYLEQVEAARLVFRTLPPIPDVGLLQSRASNDVGVAEILQRYGLRRAAVCHWDYHAALAGNYFHDDPRAV